MNDKPSTRSIEEAIDVYIEMAQVELHHRWQHWQLDLSKKEMYEVVGALIARQTTLAVQLAGAPQIMNEHIAPLILRSMADVHITLAWIFIDPLERARQFIDYGLGQEKLQIEHLKAQIVKAGGDAEESEMIKYRENWLNARRYDFLTEVTIGNWGGTDTRKMAEETGCLDIYHNIYQAFSSTTHNTWNHIAQFNLKVCRNPLHKYHFNSHIRELNPNIEFLLGAGRLLEITFELFDEKTSNAQPPPSAYKELMKVFDEPDPSGDKK